MPPITPPRTCGPTLPPSPLKGRVVVAVEENEHFLVNRELRDIELTKSDMAWVNG